MGFESKRFDLESDTDGCSGFRREFSTECSAFPEDLRTWISEPELAGLVEDAVQQVRGAERRVGCTAAWDVLLGIITYSYVTGQYASEEIENSLKYSAHLDHVHSLVFGNAPASTVLRRFRRVNRGAIEQCLAAVIRSACGHLKGSESQSLDYLHEANARVAHAIQVDSWALDV